MKYEPNHNWEKVEQKVLDDIHKIKVKELETGKKKTKWINFSHWQTDDDRWKRHVDDWVDRLINSTKSKI